MAYEHITLDTKIGDVIDHPAFGGRGILLFPWDDREEDRPDEPMSSAPKLHLWHTHMDAQRMVDGINRLIDDVIAGHQVIYEIYTDEEKAQDPEKANTGLMFFRGRPGAPFAVVLPGGGFCYVGSPHAGFPPAMELNERGYNAFVLNYRVGEYTSSEWKSNEDLIRAVSFIREHADELGVCPEDYSVGGESAGARITSNACYGEGGTERSDGLIHPAAAILLYTIFPGHPDFTPDDPPAFFVIGGRDQLIEQGQFVRRYEEMKAVGIPVELHVYPTAPHGFAMGYGTEAEGWFDDAIRFWEDNMKDKGHALGNRGAED